MKQIPALFKPKLQSTKTVGSTTFSLYFWAEHPYRCSCPKCTSVGRPEPERAERWRQLGVPQP